MLILRGSIDTLRNGRAASMFLMKRGAKFDSEYQQISYSVDTNQVSQEYQVLEKVVNNAGGMLSSAANVSQILKEAISKQDAFKSFSDQADTIWNGKVDKGQFKSFITKLDQTCPNTTFYNLQLLAAFHLAFSQNACNFSVPGAGKTATVLAAYAYLKDLPMDDPKQVNHLVVVGPLASFAAWESEYKRVFGRSAKSKRICGSISVADRQDYLESLTTESRQNELTLISYPSMTSHQQLLKKFMDSPNRQVMFVLDEAHYIKGFEKIWGQAALSLSYFAKSRVVLTGTPAPNGFEDLQNVFKFIYPEQNIIGFSRAQLIRMSSGQMPADSVEVLKDKIRPFFTRITKTDLSLPPITFKTVHFNLNVSEKRIYDFIENIFLSKLDHKAGSLTSLLGKAKLIRLRQAASNPSLLMRPILGEGINQTDENNLSVNDVNIASLISNFQFREHSSRLAALKSLVNQALKEHKKILIWSYFVVNLEEIKDALEDLVDEIHLICGETPVEEEDKTPDHVLSRECIISKFHDSFKTAILVANPQAIGESISLHKACHVAIYFDRDFNAARYIQSKDRIHRYGLPEGTITKYYILEATNTVDADIATRLATKEERLNDLLESKEIPLFSLVSSYEEDAAEDVREILNSYQRRLMND